MQEKTEILAPETFVALPALPVGPLWPFAPATSGVVSCPADVPGPASVHRAPPAQRRLTMGIVAPVIFAALLSFSGCYTAQALHQAHARGVLEGAEFRPKSIMVVMILLKAQLDLLGHKIVELSDAADQAKKKYDDLRTFKFDDPILPLQRGEIRAVPINLAGPSVEPILQHPIGHARDLPTLGGTAKDVQP